MSEIMVPTAPGNATSRMRVTNWIAGSPPAAISSLFTYPALFFDPATVERASAYTDLIPAGWATVHIDLYWTNAGTTAGNVTWLMRTGSLVGEGDTVNTPSFGSGVTAAAGAQNVVVKTRVGTSHPVQPGEPLNLYLIRNASEAADTLANDAVLLWAEVVKAS